MNFISNDYLLSKALDVESVYPLFTTEINKTSITYDFIPYANENINECQLKLRVIAKSYDEVKELEMIIRSFMDMKKNKPYILSGKTYFHSELAGGGCLYNDSYDMYENLLIFQIKWRER